MRPRPAPTSGITLSTTRSGIMPSQGDIVLIPVPFTDLSSTRRRPVIVISNDQYNQNTVDMVVVSMTSYVEPHPHSFVITSADLVSGTLNRPSRVRVDK